MGLLCFGTYIKALLECKNTKTTQKQIVNSLLSLFTIDFDDSDTAISKLANGFNNPPAELLNKVRQIANGDHSELISTFNNNTLTLLNPNKLPDSIRLLSVVIAEDKDISDNTMIGPFSGVRKKDLTGTVNDQSVFLTELLIYSLINTDNRQEQGFVKETITRCKELMCNYVFPKPKVFDSAELIDETELLTQEEKAEFKTADNDEYINLKAREIQLLEENIEKEAITFCNKYDTEKELIPLCQIAKITNPTRQHSKLMYNDYCCSSSSVQKRILEINDISVINVQNQNWWLNGLKGFEQNYKKYNLGEERYLYAFGQYFPRMIDYKDYPVGKYTKYIFEPKVNAGAANLVPNRKLGVIGLIDEYIYYNKFDEYKDLLVPPMDFMWNYLNFWSCDERDLIMNLGVFIIGTCCATPRDKDVSYFGDEFFLPSISSIRTAEDLFYLTLAHLYVNYDCNYN